MGTQEKKLTASDQNFLSYVNKLHVGAITPPPAGIELRNARFAQHCFYKY